MSADELRAELQRTTEALERERRRRRELDDKYQDAKAEARQAEQRIAQLEAIADEFHSVLETAADGDLSERMDSNYDDQALQRIAKAYNQMADEWAEIIGQVDEFSEEVATSSEQVTDRVETATDSAEAVEDAVLEIADGADEQNEYIQEISSEMETLSATIEEIAASAEDVANQTKNAVERGTTGRQKATESIERLNELEETTQATVEKVERLNERMNEIQEVAAFIDDVAEQTNILALNANIEAARAGDSGAGFAVVANEVKSLADETREATEEIEGSIKEVRTQTTETVTEMHETSDTVTSTIETIEAAIDELQTIVDQIDDVNGSVQEISRGTDTQAEATQEVVAMVDDVGDISQRTVQQSDRVADTAQTQVETLSETTSSVSTLAQRAERLESLVSEFKIHSDGAVAGTAAADAQTVVPFYHAMGGQKADLLEQLAADFESQADGVRLELESYGSYQETLNETLASVTTRNPPAIAQIYEIGTKQAMDSGGFVPVEEVLPTDQIDFSDFLDPVLNYYRTDGTLYSMPFNSSNPILIYNVDAFEAAGLDPTAPPETFEELFDVSETLVDAGVTDYGITFANYSWFVEQWFAQANQQLVDHRNGRDGSATEAYLDSDVGRDLFENWTGLAANDLYHNPGIEARGAARELFLEERAGMAIISTSSLTSVESNAQRAGIDVETGYLPVLGDRNGVVVGGASLWIAEDVPERRQRAAGEFLAWLTEPEQQVRWHKNTGYFPVRNEAVRRLRSEGWFQEHPHYETAFEQLRDRRSTPATNGARIGPFDSVRTIIAEGFESMTADTVDSELPRINDQIERVLSQYQESQ